MIYVGSLKQNNILRHSTLIFLHDEHFKTLPTFFVAYKAEIKLHEKKSQWTDQCFTQRCSL